MNFFNYAIKCVIRNLIYKLMKPRNLIILLISAIIIFFLSSYTQVFGYQGNNDYTDKNATITMMYDSINQDLVNRLWNYNKNNNVYQEFISYLQNNNYSYYAYYGQINGSDMISSVNYATNTIYIKFYDNEDKTVNVSIYDIYQGMTTNISQITGGVVTTFVFEGNSLINLESTGNFYLPTVLLSYKSPVLYSLINNNSSETSEIVGAINQQTNTIEQQTQVIEEQTEAMTSTDYDENEVFIDTNSAQVDISTEQGLFQTIFTNFNSSINNTSVEYLEIPLVNNQSLRIPSNLVSSRLGALTALVNAFWYYLFGFYAFKFVNNLLVSIKSGNILNGYNSTEVITSDMM